MNLTSLHGQVYMDPNLVKNWIRRIYIDQDPLKLDLVILHELKPIIELDPIGL
jgi:hypothetical protein